uniref:Membrane magnesium transporter n=1 Tax=Callorhinchus milii TaxID=7868 RepID=A0A4W3H0F8_CALMI
MAATIRSPDILMLRFLLSSDRSYMRLTEKENETLPIDICLQTLLAFILTCYGIVHIAGEFKDMDATSELKNKTFDTLRNHPSFYLFNHRGRVLFRSADEENNSLSSPSPASNNPLHLRKLDSARR